MHTFLKMGSARRLSLQLYYPFDRPYNVHILSGGLKEKGTIFLKARVCSLGPPGSNNVLLALHDGTHNQR